MSILFCVLVIGCSDYSRIFLGLGVTSCLAFERECGQMWLNPKGVVWWGVIVVPTSWRPEQPWCPLEGDTCPSNQQPAAHQYNSLRWHRVFVNETWTLSCSIWWRHRAQNSLFCIHGIQFDGAPKTKSLPHETNGFWVQIIQSGPWDQILGGRRTNAIQHFGGNRRTSSHFRLSFITLSLKIALGLIWVWGVRFYQLAFNRYEVQGLKLLAEAWENLE